MLPAETRMVFSVFPSHTNHYHTLFGGTAMAWMDQAAFICGTRWCRTKVVTVHSSEISFKQPVPEGSIAEVVAWISATGRTSMTIPVEMYVELMDRDERILACRGEFVLVAMGADGRPTAVPARDPDPREELPPAECRTQRLHEVVDDGI
ncbi:acyl-CoA thioesterase [Longimicrobium terrae]|nr:acyl-CoA thioesterase [Longimicrobium terrae]